MQTSIKLSKWAKLNGYSYRGAYELFHRGGIPNAFQLPSGAIMIADVATSVTTAEQYTAIYARVSTPKQKNDLVRQVEYISDFCVANGWPVDKIYREVASGLDDSRPVLNKLLDNEKITRVVVSEKDRLTRFGFNYLKKWFDRRNIELVVINDAVHDEDDLMQDFVSVITSMTARIYGLRRHKSHVEKILNDIEDHSKNQ